MLDSVPIADSYALGYFLSKWAAEHLLRSAHRDAGLSVDIVRPSLILPDRRIAGEINRDDLLARLIFSMIHAGIAPGPPEGTADEDGFRVEGVPVDILAEAIVELDTLPAAGLRVFNACNFWEIGPSLERLATWIESAGYKLGRIPSRAEWLDRIAQVLSERTAEEQSHSIVNLLDAFRKPPVEALGLSGCKRFQDLLLKTYDRPLPTLLTEEFVRKSLRDLESLGLLPELVS